MKHTKEKEYKKRL